MAANNTRVFVYGSLKQGLGNHRLLSTSKYIGTCIVPLAARMYSLGGFPALVPASGETRAIVGEVYQVTEEVLGALDMLEGHPRWYKRDKIHTPWKKAWCYFMPNEFIDTDKKYEVQNVWRPSEAELEALRKYNLDKLPAPVELKIAS